MTELSPNSTAFVARVAAGATHEIRNVLATIKESAGVIKDMMALLERDRPLNPQIVEKVLQRIDNQVGRGVDLIAGLNNLAHSLDQANSQIELNQQVRQIAVLSQHSVRRKGHTVTVETDEEELSLEVNALSLQHVLFAAVQICVAQLAAKGTVIISTRREEEPKRLRIEVRARQGGEGPAASPVTENAEGTAELVQLGEELGADVEFDSDNQSICINFPV